MVKTLFVDTKAQYTKNMEEETARRNHISVGERLVRGKLMTYLELIEASIKEGQEDGTDPVSPGAARIMAEEEWLETEVAPDPQVKRPKTKSYEQLKVEKWNAALCERIGNKHAQPCTTTIGDGVENGGEDGSVVDETFKTKARALLCTSF
jgi:hypothetical protein